jgi:hypothetical protein
VTDTLFAGRAPAVRETYTRLLAGVERLGTVIVEAKQTSIHLVAGAGGSAFAGVHPRKAALLLTIRSDAPIASPRVRAAEQVSRHRWHNDVLLAGPGEVDDELLGWLRAAHALAAGRA